MSYKHLRRYQNHPLVASQEYVDSQEKGEFMPKNLRTVRVNEIRSSHFTLGHEPTKHLTTNTASPEVLHEKWQARQNVNKG